jgi:tRNA pseudouridine55 synthase
MEKDFFIIINKDKGISSASVGKKLKKILNTPKVGHIGTLDPLASGVLICAINQATKVIPYYQESIKENFSEKEYHFTICFGERRSTDDEEGIVLQTCNKRPSLKEIESILVNFKGEIVQKPPLFSAIHIDGKRAYQLARSLNSKEILDPSCYQAFYDTLQTKVPNRRVKIQDLHILDRISENKIRFSVSCGPGTYVRSLSRDIAEKCGTVGYVTDLVRVRDRSYSLDQSITLSELKEKLEIKTKTNTENSFQSNQQDLICKLGFIEIEKILFDIPKQNVSYAEALKLSQGKTIQVHFEAFQNQKESMLLIKYNQILICLAELSYDILKPKRVFWNRVTSNRDKGEGIC